MRELTLPKLAQKEVLPRLLSVSKSQSGPNPLSLKDLGLEVVISTEALFRV